MTMLRVSASGGLMSKLFPVQISNAACWNRKAKPTVSSTCRSGSKPNGRRKIRSISRPTTAIASAATGSASAHEPVVQMTDSATYPPNRKYEPCDRLTMRITPKMSESPLPTRNNRAP